MLPLRDANPRYSTPYVNYALLAINIGVWLVQWTLMASGATWLVAGYGVVPTRIVADPSGEWLTVLSSMFMHGGWAHLGGNMLFLYIFGDNVEDAVGHGRYALFYLASGIAAATAQVMVGPSSPVPMVGASGAIAGVLGGYLVLYPKAPITVLNPFAPLWLVFGLFFVFPAWLVVGEWFAWNLLRGLGALGRGAEGGVAFFAHIGGFIAGLLLIRPATRGRVRRLASKWSGWQPPRSPGGSPWPRRGPRGRSPWS